MIAALRGTYRGRTGDAVIVDAGGIGYEVILPPIVEQGLGTLDDGVLLDLRIGYIATRETRLRSCTDSPAKKRNSSGRC